MKTNLEIVLDAIGYKGGNIHQLADDLGFSAMLIINPVEIDSVQALDGYAFWNADKSERLIMIGTKKNKAAIVSSIINAYRVREKHGMETKPTWQA